MCDFFLSINLCEILKVAGYVCWVCEIIMSARHMSLLGAQVRRGISPGTLCRLGV